MDKSGKIFVAGHLGMVGSAIIRALEREGYSNLILKSRKELDLADQQAVRSFFDEQHPEYVFMAGIVDIDSRYFKKKIDQGVQTSTINYTTNVYGKHTEWQFFNSDEKF